MMLKAGFDFVWIAVVHVAVIIDEACSAHCVTERQLEEVKSRYSIGLEAAGHRLGKAAATALGAPAWCCRQIVTFGR